MRTWIASFGVLVIWCIVTTGAQQKAAPPNISGAWERYGAALGQPTGDAQRRDGTAPPRSEQPMVKPAYQKEYQDRLTAVRDANAKGAPLASNYVDCLGDGMPLMMAAMFPIEFLQSPGQVTVIEEAFTQVRRIRLDQAQKMREFNREHTLWLQQNLEATDKVVQIGYVREDIVRNDQVCAKPPPDQLSG
jgi:hypothetical protein